MLDLDVNARYTVFLYFLSVAPSSRLREIDMRIARTTIIACCLVFAATECLADSIRIDPQKYPIRGIRGGDTSAAVEKALTGQFQKTKCAFHKCFGTTIESSGGGGKMLRFEMITVSFTGLGQAYAIEYEASYAKGSNAAECRPYLDTLRSEVLSRYGSPADMKGPDTMYHQDRFVAKYLAEGAPKNPNPLVNADEFMNASGSCEDNGKLFVKMEFGSEAISLDSRSQATSAKPEF